MIHHTQKKGFSILLALGFMILMSSIGIYLLTYIVPFSRSVVGIEHASNAYYQGYAGIEEALLLSYSGGIGFDVSTGATLDIDYGFNTYSSGTIIPRPGFGGSPFDDGWNTISQEQGIQLSVGDNRLVVSGTSGNRLLVRFRVPDFDANGSPDTLNTSINDIILWQLSGETDSSSSENGNLIRRGDITGGNINIWSGTRSNGILQNGSTTNADFNDFYDNNCGSGSGCSLKFSLINPLFGNTGGNPSIPFLEYQIETLDPIPTQFRQIQASGQSVGFRKNLEISVLQQNTNVAFDFAIFQ